MAFNKSYEDLMVWQKSVDLAEQVYIVTKEFPKDELYGLISQIRRCAVSIPSNIAEGCARSSSKEFLRFLSISLGSTAELKTQFILAKRIAYIDEIVFNNFNKSFVEIERMLHGLRRSLLATCNLQLATRN